jgi:hypothetical protein
MQDFVCLPHSQQQLPLPPSMIHLQALASAQFLPGGAAHPPQACLRGYTHRSTRIDRSRALPQEHQHGCPPQRSAKNQSLASMPVQEQERKRTALPHLERLHVRVLARAGALRGLPAPLLNPLLLLLNLGLGLQTQTQSCITHKKGHSFPKPTKRHSTVAPLLRHAQHTSSFNSLKSSSKYQPISMPRNKIC